MSPFWRVISFPLVQRQEPSAPSFLPTLIEMLSLANGARWRSIPWVSYRSAKRESGRFDRSLAIRFIKQGGRRLHAGRFERNRFVLSRIGAGHGKVDRHRMCRRIYARCGIHRDVVVYERSVKGVGGGAFPSV